MKVAVIGGGAAGFFGAIQCVRAGTATEVHIFERSNKLLSKLRISGGGRCNVTHACFDNGLLINGYPRGHKELKGPFERFNTSSTVQWFKEEGITLKTEADGRMFPTTDNAETIALCLIQEASNLNIRIHTNSGVKNILTLKSGFMLDFLNRESQHFDKVLIASGGGPTIQSFDWLAALGHKIIEPVPSLFTFNIEDSSLHELAGLSVQDALLKIKDTKLEQRGPTLVTHWGLSGPAILKLSAWGARELKQRDYTFELIINWLPNYKEEELREAISITKEDNIRKQMGSFSPFTLPLRLWKWLLQNSGIEEDLKWADLPKKSLNKLIENLLRQALAIKGKSTFKEEFVTAGGVSLKDINLQTMESKIVPGLYFAGEVMDIDGITGGYNFQAAWTTGYIAGSNMAINH